MIAQENLSVDKSIDVVNGLYKKSKKEVQVIDNYAKRMFKVYVDSLEGNTVRINLPIILVKSTIAATGKLPIKTTEVDGIDIERLSSIVINALKNEVIGEIVRVDSSQGDRVKIIIE